MILIHSLQPTWGNYLNQVNGIDGVIIADLNESPGYVGPRLGVKVFPALQVWSDVVFLQWQQHVAAVNIRNIKYIFRASIGNRDSRTQIIQAFRHAGLDEIPAWPGHTFKIDPSTLLDPDTGRAPDSFFGILGSKNGAGCAFILAQHKAAFGAKTLSSVAVWAQDAWSLEAPEIELKVSMYFTVQDSPTPPSTSGT
jgi:hypothetical protein